MLQLQTTNEPEHKPWLRMEGEPVRWYTRFILFRVLGPKRTILAAVEQERAHAKAPKSTQKPKKAHVPGSWKAACITWRWVERARAYDEDKVTKMVEVYFEDLYQGPALAFHRVQYLRNILETMTADYNKNNAHMTPEQHIAYYARMTAILKDIREEMAVFDAPTQVLLMRHLAYKEYEDFKHPLTKEGYLQLAERSGGVDAMLKS